MRSTKIISAVFISFVIILAGCGGGGSSSTNPLLTSAGDNAGTGSSSSTSSATGGGADGGGQPVGAGVINLAWDAESSPVAGYKIYYGTSSGNYGSVVDVGNVTAYSLSGLNKGATYYLAASAYDGSGNESIKSNEVSGAAN